MRGSGRAIQLSCIRISHLMTNRLTAIGVMCCLVAFAPARLAAERMADAGHPYRFEHLSFSNAGHLVASGIDPAITEAKHPNGIMLAFGGNERGKPGCAAAGVAQNTRVPESGTARR